MSVANVKSRGRLSHSHCDPISWFRTTSHALIMASTRTRLCGGCHGFRTPGLQSPLFPTATSSIARVNSPAGGTAVSHSTRRRAVTMRFAGRRRLDARKPDACRFRICAGRRTRARARPGPHVDGLVLLPSGYSEQPLDVSTLLTRRAATESRQGLKALAPWLASHAGFAMWVIILPTGPLGPKDGPKFLHSYGGPYSGAHRGETGH